MIDLTYPLLATLTQATILHVMNFYDKDVDYMVGAQLEGFDVMVKLTEENDFIVLEKYIFL